jgi:hypothetical protein
MDRPTQYHCIVTVAKLYLTALLHTITLPTVALYLTPLLPSFHTYISYSISVSGGILTDLNWTDARVIPIEADHVIMETYLCKNWFALVAQAYQLMAGGKCKDPTSLNIR